jgi:transketolase
MRNTFVETLMELAEEKDNLYLVTGDLGFGVLKPFWEKYPERFINAGIAEQNMTGVTAGMALEGNIVFTYSIGNFPTLRCLEQIRNDCAYHGANVKIVCVGGGFVYGSLGMSHHATEDIAVLRALPDVAVFCPGDLVEARYATRAIAEHEGTCYLRLGRGGEKRLHDDLPDFKIGKAIRVRDGNKAAIFSTGGILDNATRAAELLNEEGISTAQLSFTTVKPIDREAIIEYGRKCDVIVTCEEHNIVGGFGSAVAEVMAEEGFRAKLCRIGLNDTYSSIVGDQNFLREKYGMDSKNIIASVKDVLKYG